MKISAFISNLIFICLNKRSYKVLLSACDDPESEQKKVLLAILRRNEDSEFGIKHGFHEIKTTKEFQNNVPLSTYEDYINAINRTMDGEHKALCYETINYFALSSGSSSASKYIPYTNSLKDEFNKALNPWIYNMLTSYKDLKYGKQFWIITPSTLPQNLPESKVPIGFEEDRNYFGRIGSQLLKYVMCLPDPVSKVTNNTNYFYLLSYCLLAEQNLRLISVWNPGLIISIFDFISSHYKQLCNDLSSGTIHLPHPEVNGDRDIASKCLKHMPGRGNFLSKLPEFNSEKTKLIWPKLKLISCWTDAWAGAYIDAIKKLLPDIEIQGKGLLATEGLVSIPLAQLPWPLLTIQSQFYEFRNLEDQKIYLSHELEKDKRYEVFLTGSGGFYRYALNDIIEVKGFFKKTALIKFIGKDNIISDLCGEKLNESFVAKVLQAISKKYFSKEEYMCLAPYKNGDQFFYTLYIEISGEENITDHNKIIRDLENGLRQNFHYAHCREMHQLEKPKIVFLDTASALKNQTQRLGKNISSTRKFSYLETALINPDEFKKK